MGSQLCTSASLKFNPPPHPLEVGARGMGPVSVWTPASVFPAVRRALVGAQMAARGLPPGVLVARASYSEAQPPLRLRHFGEVRSCVKNERHELTMELFV